MSSPYFWSGFLVLLVMFAFLYNVLLDIRIELRRQREHADAERRAERYERLMGKDGS